MITARHERHRYRRALIASALAEAPISSGPQHCLSRTPWPCSTRLPPAGRLAFPQPGQWLGRASLTLGDFSLQLLTLTLIRMIDVLLRGEFDNDRYGARREGINLPAPLTLSAGPVADAPLPPRFYIAVSDRGRSDSAMVTTGRRPHVAGSENALKPSTSPRGNTTQLSVLPVAPHHCR
jgi:hypothetical protein